MGIADVVLTKEDAVEEAPAPEVVVLTRGAERGGWSW